MHIPGFFLLSTLAVTACGSFHEHGKDDGQKLVAPRPAPPASWEELELQHVNPEDYELVPLDTTDLAKHMIVGSEAQQVPSNLQGIWWMDGNVLAPGSVTSLAKALWDLPHHKMLIQEYGPNNYTYDDTDEGRKSFQQAVADNLIFETTFNASYTEGRLIQVSNQQKQPIELYDYTMSLVADGDWLRRSVWKGVPAPDYHLRRIIDGQGRPVEPAYSAFLKVAPARSLIPRLRPLSVAKGLQAGR